MIIINGQKKEIALPVLLEEALVKFGYNIDAPFAVAVNKRLVTKANYSIYYLKDEDEIDVVYPMQGG